MYYPVGYKRKNSCTQAVISYKGSGATVIIMNSTFWSEKKFIIPAGLCLIMLLAGSVLSGMGGSEIAAGNLKNNFYEAGQKALARGDYRTAVHNFRQATERNPHYTRAHSGTARAYYKMGEMIRARNAYLRVLAKDKNNLEALIGLGMVHTELGEYDLAEAYLEQVSEIDPGNTENNYARGLFYLRKGSLDLAQVYFKKVERQNPAHIDSLLQLAVLEAGRGEYIQAEEFLKQARLVNPVSPEMHRVAGEIKLRQALNNKDELSRVNLLDEAYFSFMTALQIAPENTSIEKNLVIVELHRLRRTDGGMGAKMKAIRTRAERILGDFPRDHGLNYLVGALARLEGDTYQNAANALEYFQKALDIEPQDSIARFALEEIVLGFKREFPAGGALRKSMGDYHYGRVKYYLGLNRRERMRQHLRRTLIINPLHNRAIGDLLSIFRRDGNFEGFIQTLIKLRDRRPDEPRLQYRLERALKGKNQSLAYRENLLSPEMGKEQATFERTPSVVFVFDFQPAVSFPLHLNAPRLIGQALEFHLHGRGRVEPAPADFREAVINEVGKYRPEGSFFTFGNYYNPGHIARIEEVEGKKEMVDLVVGGSFHSTPNSLAVTYEVYQKRNGRLLDKFTFQAQGKDAIHEISARAALRIRNRAVFSGKVIKVNSRGVFLNLGAIDEVKVGSRMIVYRKERVGAGSPRLSRYDTEVFRKYLLKNKKGLLCEVKQIARYISRCEPVKSRIDDFHFNDIAVMFEAEPKKETAANGAGNGAQN